jgi:Spy/CpxP family protein refolding chaperone
VAQRLHSRARQEDVMKKLIRVISTCSIVGVGIVAVPAVASADTAREETGSAVQAFHGADAKEKRKEMREIFEALDLRPEQQKAVRELVAEAEERHAGVRDARRNLMTKLADQIEKGRIDECALESEIDELAAAKTRAKKGDRAALDRLHSILDPEQRAKFVDEVQRRLEKKERAHDPDAVIEKMDRKLDLTDEQESALRQYFSALRALKEADPEHKEKRDFSKVLEAFRGDDFSIDEVSPPRRDMEEKQREKIEARLWAAKGVVCVLTDEQRAEVAAAIRQKVEEKAERKGEIKGKEQQDQEKTESGEGEDEGMTGEDESQEE